MYLDMARELDTNSCDAAVGKLLQVEEHLANTCRLLSGGF